MLCALIIGVLVGFLWFNVHPAQIFMGDSGRSGLGATLAVVATVNGQLPLLVIVGIVFFAVIMSVVLQVLSYRLRGRRIFRMAPLHHHFELPGLGRGEDHAPLLDRGRPGRDARVRIFLVGVSGSRWPMMTAPAGSDRLRADLRGRAPSCSAWLAPASLPPASSPMPAPS